MKAEDYLKAIQEQIVTQDAVLSALQFPDTNPVTQYRAAREDLGVNQSYEAYMKSEASSQLQSVRTTQMLFDAARMAAEGIPVVIVGYDQADCGRMLREMYHRPGSNRLIDNSEINTALSILDIKFISVREVIDGKLRGVDRRTVTFEDHRCTEHPEYPVMKQEMRLIATQPSPPPPPPPPPPTWIVTKVGDEFTMDGVTVTSVHDAPVCGEQDEDEIVRSHYFCGRVDGHKGEHWWCTPRLISQDGPFEKVGETNG